MTTTAECPSFIVVPIFILSVFVQMIVQHQRRSSDETIGVKTLSTLVFRLDIVKAYYTIILIIGYESLTESTQRHCGGKKTLPLWPISLISIYVSLFFSRNIQLFESWICLSFFPTNAFDLQDSDNIKMFS